MRFHGAYVSFTTQIGRFARTALTQAEGDRMIDAGERPMIQTRISTFASRLLRTSGKVLMVACLFTSAAILFGKVDVAAANASPASEWIQQLELAASLVDSGQLDAAEAVYRRALRAAERDGDYLRAAVVLHNIGGLLEHKGEFREAEKALLRAISALRRAATGDDRLMVRSSAALAVVQIQMGQYSKTEALIRSVLVDHPAGAAQDKASLTGSLGVALAHLQRFEEAQQFLQETVDLCNGAEGAAMQETGAIATANLAAIRMRLGHTADSITLYRRALAIIEGLPNPFPVTHTSALSDYAKAIFMNGDPNTAEGLYRKAIAVAESRLGQKHIVLARLLQEYAELLRETGRKAEAREMAATGRRIQGEAQRENLTGYTVELNTLLKGK